MLQKITTEKISIMSAAFRRSCREVRITSPGLNVTQHYPTVGVDLERWVGSSPLSIRPYRADYVPKAIKAGQ